LEIFSHDSSSVPDGEISNDLSGVGRFLIFGLLFFDSDVDAVDLEIFVTKGCGVHSISGLHSSKDGWSGHVELGVLEVEGLSFMSDRVLGNTTEPLSVSVFRNTPSNPRDLFDISHLSESEFLFSLDHNLESFAGDVSLSSGVGVILLHCSDLSEHNWSLTFLVFMFEVDSLPFGTGG